ncbi:MAG: SDR family oxidoreductase [Nanoarchaeota archaeon]
MNKKNILVTGALGHIGSELIREYAKREDIGKIRILDNFLTQRYYSLFNLPNNINYEFIEGDIRDKISAEKAVKDIDVVLHLAAITDAPATIAKKEETMSVNLNGTECILESSIKYGVKRFIFPSSTSVYGEAEGIVDENTPIDRLRLSSPYAESKLDAEKIVMEANGKSGIETIVLRNGTIFGTSVGMRFHTAINKFVYLAAMNKPLTIWDSARDSKRPYLGLDDALKAFQFAEDKGNPGEIYNVLTKNFTMNEIIEAIRKIKPEVKIEITKSPLLNQKPYEVSNEKFCSLGFTFKDKLEDCLEESFGLLNSIKNN